MRLLNFRFLAVLALFFVWAAALPQEAAAKPYIKFSVEKVHLHHAGEVEVVGYLVNSGDQGAYVKWTDLDITLIADNGQEMWSDYGIRHYVNDVYVPAGEYKAYTCYVQNPNIPSYHGKYRFRCHTNTHWEKNAG